MQIAPRFLVVDFHAESRFLLVRTLLRKFPTAEIIEEEEIDRVLDVARDGRLTAAIVHRTFDLAGAELVQQIRTVDAKLPIIMVSAMDRFDDATAAGANTFLRYDEWLRIGSVVDEQIQGSAAPFPPSPEVPQSPETSSSSASAA